MVLLISFKGDHVNGTRVIKGLPFSGLIPCLRPQAVLAIDTGKPTILSGWDASTSADSTIITRTLDEYNVEVRRGTWRKILRRQRREAL